MHPINMHLHDRSVGCIAYLSGSEGLWLATDDTWEAGTARRRWYAFGARSLLETWIMRLHGLLPEDTAISRSSLSKA